MNRRVIGGYELKNPIVDDVKTKFPFAFEISMMIVPILFKYKRVYVTEDEISYLTVYVAQFLENENVKLKTIVVTSQRHSVKQLLTQCLEMYFKNQIAIVDIINKETLKKMDLTSIDLVITLDSFLILKDVEVFSMDKLPEIKDIERLNSMIHMIRMNKRVSKILDCYIQKEHVKVYPDTKELPELLKEMSKKLHESGFISDTKGFYEDVLLREKNYPTNLGSQMMVPHVQLVFLLALEKKRNDEMNLLFQFFNQIVSHKKYMHALLQSEDSDAFIKNLYSFKLLE